MIITGFVNKNSLPRIVDDNGTESYQFPKIFVNRKSIEEFCPSNQVVEITVEILPKKVHS